MLNVKLKNSILRYTFQTDRIENIFCFLTDVGKIECAMLKVKQIAKKQNFMSEVIASKNITTTLLMDMYFLYSIALRANGFI